ncbi:hypothetical protein [Rahnella bonaserana]|uniref:Uncharacterized protein n=1 Tax=Rahnella bonaserana TaxID=2816248 RepID=A0ABS6LQC1_9GAMM|nr:hypothetical protein [Rahnella bonaserana]MBU9854232.1 hypothetical protein [Rahnella bonaserana]MCL9641595.1 hypothetical protein [Rahnella victoriana]
MARDELLLTGVENKKSMKGNVMIAYVSIAGNICHSELSKKAALLRYPGLSALYLLR